VYQQYGNFGGLGAGFMAHVNQIIVAADKNIGELHDRLLRVGRQDAYQKYCQRQELQKTDWELVHGDPLFRLAGPCLRVGLAAAEMSAGLYIDSRQLSCGKKPAEILSIGQAVQFTGLNFSLDKW
jgi:hypothetical protein